VSNNAPQGFYYLEMLQSQKIFSSLSAVRTIEPSRPDDHLSLFHPSGRCTIPSGRTRTVSYSFQVPIKGRSINRPDDVVSHPDARLLKARISIQISPSGRLTAVVQTRVHQRRKLPIRLQPSGRLPIMVRTRALQIWKLRVEE